VALRGRDVGLPGELRGEESEDSAERELGLGVFAAAVFFDARAFGADRRESIAGCAELVEFGLFHGIGEDAAAAVDGEEVSRVRLKIGGAMSCGSGQGRDPVPRGGEALGGDIVPECAGHEVVSGEGGAIAEGTAAKTQTGARAADFDVVKVTFAGALLALFVSAVAEGAGLVGECLHEGGVTIFTDGVGKPAAESDVPPETVVARVTQEVHGLLREARVQGEVDLPEDEFGVSAGVAHQWRIS